MNTARVLTRGLLALLMLPLAACADAPDPGALTLPNGFHVAIYADGVDGARELALGTNGTVFVGSNNRKGTVFALSGSAQSTQASKVHVIASGLREPTGVAFHDGDLYVSSFERIVVLRDIEAHLDNPPAPELITDKLPKETHHGRKFLRFGPDGRLYVPIGAPCNVCDKGNAYAKLISMKADGSDWRDEAYGIRNTVGFDWQPLTQRLWFTDNGRDMLGDDMPSDELNELTHIGENFGFPYCNQGDTLDPEFGQGKSCPDYTAPVVKLGAHVASLGMRFYTGTMFPPAYRGAVIIAEHGSWNRTKKAGYRVVAVNVTAGEPHTQTVLVNGFERKQEAFGRPVDVLVMPDGAVLVSDDMAGVVYRVSYSKSTQRSEAN